MPRYVALTLPSPGMETTAVRRGIDQTSAGALELSVRQDAPAAVGRPLRPRAPGIGLQLVRNPMSWPASSQAADMYLAVVVSWLQSPVLRQAADTIAPADYPNLQSHNARVFTRPAAAKALREELALFRAG